MKDNSYKRLDEQIEYIDSRLLIAEKIVKYQIEFYGNIPEEDSKLNELYSLIAVKESLLTLKNLYPINNYQS